MHAVTSNFEFSNRTESLGLWASLDMELSGEIPDEYFKEIRPASEQFLIGLIIPL